MITILPAEEELKEAHVRGDVKVNETGKIAFTSTGNNDKTERDENFIPYTEPGITGCQYFGNNA